MDIETAKQIVTALHTIQVQIIIGICWLGVITGILWARR